MGQPAAPDMGNIVGPDEKKVKQADQIPFLYGFADIPANLSPSFPSYKMELCTLHKIINSVLTF